MSEEEAIEWFGLEELKDSKQLWLQIYKNAGELQWDQKLHGEIITVSPNRKSFSYGKLNDQSK